MECFKYDGIESYFTSNVVINLNIDKDGTETITIFRYGCSCGESYEEADAAWSCRKCYNYLLDEDYSKRTVTDLLTGKQVGR